MPRLSLPRNESDSPAKRLLRVMMLISVFVCVGWLYTKHFDRAIDDIKTRSSVYDQTEALSTEQKAQFRKFASMFREEFGIELRLRITDGPMEIPEMKSKTLFMGVDTRQKLFYVEFPRWMTRALGQDFVENLRTRHMAPYFESDSWPTGLMQALKLVWDRLFDLNQPPQETQ